MFIIIRNYYLVRNYGQRCNDSVHMYNSQKPRIPRCPRIFDDCLWPGAKEAPTMLLYLFIKSFSVIHVNVILAVRYWQKSDYLYDVI